MYNFLNSRLLLPGPLIYDIWVILLNAFDQNENWNLLSDLLLVCTLSKNEFNFKILLLDLSFQEFLN